MIDNTGSIEPILAVPNIATNTADYFIDGRWTNYSLYCPTNNYGTLSMLASSDKEVNCFMATPTQN